MHTSDPSQIPYEPLQQAILPYIKSTLNKPSTSETVGGEAS